MDLFDPISYISIGGSKYCLELLHLDILFAGKISNPRDLKEILKTSSK
jgi:hypothetical protein